MAQFGDAEALLDSADGALAVVAARRRVLYANGAFRAMLRAVRTLRIVDGVLEFAPLSRAAADACEHLLDPKPAAGASAKFFPISVQSGPVRFVAIAPVPHRMRDFLRVTEPAVLVRVAHETALRDARRDAVAECFGLTPAETRVLGHLLRGAGVDEIASLTSTSPSTVRTQVKHIYRRAGVHRQTALMALATEQFDASLRFGL